MYSRLYFVKFRTPYHVGWREIRSIIDHTTILRALIYISSIIGLEGFIKYIKKGNLRATALLPLVKTDETYRLLTIFPRLPSKVKVTKLGVKWITLSGLKTLLDHTTKCIKDEGISFIREKTDSSLKITCFNRELTHEKDQLELSILKKKTDKSPTSIVDSMNGKTKFVEEEPIFKDIFSYRNRIDRITGSADPFILLGYLPENFLWLYFKSNEDRFKTVFELLKLLGEMGLGAYRSRGWGRFYLIEDLDVDQGDLEVLEKYSEWNINSYNALLGSMLFTEEIIDFNKSYIYLSRIEGRSGPSNNEYILPTINVADVGSIVFLKYRPKYVVTEITTSYPYKPIIIFNPVVIGGVS
ncbi:MAG: hypothetical protein B6U89_07330 [Desulfurococcales archaeon ex4484_58]|nr:MAG: hypothetical protein B6U89_07330 [Desulfurococcales archaeon ex4484_58]